MPPQNPEQVERYLRFVKRHYTERCPSCTGHTLNIPYSLVKGCFYCPVCEKIWRVICLDHSKKKPIWKWFYFDISAWKKIENVD